MSILTLAAKAVSAVRCDDMATTSIWRVKGWLGKVVIYVENPDKTENPAFYEKQEMTDRQTQGLSDVIDYAVSSEKTKVTDEATEVMQQFVSGVNCHPATAREEMIAVKKRFGKEDGTVAYHGYQSFAPGEATPEMAHEIGAKLAQQLWGDKYQVIVATHLDKDSHLHNHFVVNTVSFLDGLKYHRTEKDYYEMQKASDALCREYNLSVIENPQRGKSKQYGEWRAEQEGRPTWRGLIRAEIDEVIRQSMTERQFFDNLRKRGYEVKVGKDISVRPPGKERFVRLERNFGEDYSYDGIRKRILAQFKRERPLPEPERKVRRARLRGDFKNTKKVTGFRALYFHYCYLLGIFPKNQPKHNKRLHFLLREDLAKLDAISEETKLLVRNRIDTVEQLSSYKEGLEAKIESLTADRKALYRKQRTVSVKTDDDALARVKEQITAISNELSVLRKEVRLCEDIAIRSGVIKEKSADGMVDVMVRAEDASKINRIVERFHLATVDTASIKHEIEKTRAEKGAGEKKEAPDVPQKGQPEKSDEDKLLDEMLGAPTRKEEPAPVNPSAARTEKSPPSAPTSEPPSKAAEGAAKSAEQRPSVRKELRDIQAQRRQEEAAAPVKEPERTKKPASKSTQHQQPPRKKKKAKER